jgi:phosphopantothenoylcysteine decarboxylase/phosphopantothenate--cysteine ligase
LICRENGIIFFTVSGEQEKMNVLISAGPTREKIDPVRFISNASSGKMGGALAAAAVKAGCSVTLVSGPVSAKAPAGLKKLIPVESASEMAAAVKKCFASADVTVMAAAVADYTPVRFSASKIKKNSPRMTIELEKTEDILAGLGKKKKARQTLVGFAAETDSLEENALKKLRGKNLDWIVANEAGKADRGPGADKNAVIMLSAAGERIELPLQSKGSLAAKIMRIILKDHKDRNS